MTKRKHRSGRGRLSQLVVLGLAGLVLLLAGLLLGKDVVLFNPKGLIAQQQAHLMMFSITVLLAAVVPTLALLYFFAWKYRETNQKAKHDPGRRLGKTAALGLWIIPSVVILVLTSAVLPATFKLDPHKAIAADAKPLTIQVIALRWKWLFIYPQQGIATVNFVELPVNTPVEFNLTADEAPMNSFWIPHLGGQLYAMTGHDNRLNLMATTAGDYTGQAAEINGTGFAGMKFTARAIPNQDFNQWVQRVQLNSPTLTTATYNQLVMPSQNVPTSYYTTVDPNLYSNVLTKYMGSNDQMPGQMPGHMEMP